MAIQKERVNIDRTTQDIEKLINKLTSGKSFNIRNWDELRSFDARNSTLQDLSNLVSTLINELIKKGIIAK